MKKFLFSFLFFTASLLSGEGFAPETLIKTADGYIPIEKIEAGQLVESFDRKSNTITTNPVIANHQYNAQSYIAITLENDTLTCSCNQKFYLPTLGTWIKAKELLVDKNIRDIFCKEFAVLDIIKIQEQKKLCALTVKNHHNFFVTESNILVHNFAITLVWVIGEGLALGETAAIAIAGLTGYGLGRLIYGKPKTFHLELPPTTTDCPPLTTEEPSGGYSLGSDPDKPNDFIEDCTGKLLRGFLVPGLDMAHLLTQECHEWDKISSSHAVIVDIVTNVIKNVDNIGKATEGVNRVQTMIGNTPLEIRFFVQDHIIIGMNAFANHSNRINPIPFNLP